MTWIDRRKNIISKIVETLKKLGKKTYDPMKFREEICREYGCTMRTASEYLKIGLANFKQMEIIDGT